MNLNSLCCIPKRLHIDVKDCMCLVSRLIGLLQYPLSDYNTAKILRFLHWTKKSWQWTSGKTSLELIKLRYSMKKKLVETFMAVGAWWPAYMDDDIIEQGTQ
jgi:hypothetical protein